MFQLSKSFVQQYQDRNPNFGFNGLGELTFYRTYSRIKENGKNENWAECIERVVNTIYEIQRKHILHNRIKWNEEKAQKSAQEMFDRIFTHKFHPPGRGFWAADLKLIDKVGGAALNNCAFVSTHKIGESLTEATKPFEFLMDMSMLGVGVGFDVKGSNQIVINKPKQSDKSTTTFTIPDSREGWVESVKLLLESYFSKHFGIESYELTFDYSLIRPAGLPIKTFGGTSSGAEPLKILHNNIVKVLDKNDGKGITETTIVDIMNMIGVCVVAGNVRRTAEIAFGASEEFMDLKNYEKNPERNDWQTGWGWTSNNSIFAELGQDYSKVAERTRINGEPGYEWLENAQNYGRMCEQPNYKDIRALGGNPLK
jgi:ribonucleotide reductase alpha subunit